MRISFKAVWGGGALLGLLLAVTGCDEKLKDVTGPTPALQPTFASIQSEIFNTTDAAGRRACVTCHTDQGRNPAGGLNLATDPYAALVGAAARERPALMRVAPGDPENSYLVQKLEGASGIAGVRMPQSGPPYLTDGQILVIKRWIATGAPRN